jgi:ATP-dependent Lon protease, bacterial type
MKNKEFLCTKFCSPACTSRCHSKRRAIRRNYNGLRTSIPGCTGSSYSESCDDRRVDAHWLSHANRRSQRKTIAAKRAGITQLIFPAENKKDFDDLDESIIGKITPYFVKTFAEVLPICFPNLKGTKKIKISKT